MKGSIVGCIMICMASLMAQAQVSGGITPMPTPPGMGPGSGSQPPAIGQCSPEEQNNIRRDAESAVLERVRQDMRVEGRSVGNGLGYDEQDCLNRATESANYRRNDALRSCEQQAQYFKTCEIVQNRIVESPTRVMPISASGSFDERNSTEDSCRTTAQNRAIQNALNTCQSRFGVNCRISSGPDAASFRIEKRRRYVIAGPKDEYFVCDSRASAIPDSNLQFQCRVELVARVMPR